MNLKKLLSSPYTYVLLLTYFGVWLAWNAIRLPFSNPEGIISYLPSIGYNPHNNVLRFIVAVFAPPAACLAYWWIVNRSKPPAFYVRFRRLFIAGFIALVLLLAICMGIVQASTNPRNNPDSNSPSDYAQLDSFHEGEALGPAVSYQDKDLKPYRDFVFVHGVFQDPGRAVLAFKLFDRSIGAVRALATILTIIAFAMLFGLFLTLFQGHVAKSALAMALFALLLTPTATLPFIGKYVLGVNLPFRDIVTLFLLIGMLLGIRAMLAQRKRLAMAVAGGVGFVVCANFANSTDRAIYGAVLSVVWLVMLALISKQKLFSRAILPAYVGGLLLGLLVAGAALKWAFVDFASFLLAVSRYKEFLDGLPFVRPEAAVSSVLLALSAGITIAGAYGLRAWQSTRRTDSLARRLQSLKSPLSKLLARHYVVILLLAAALVFLRSGVGRADLGHFAYSVQWLYVLIIFLFVQWLFARRTVQTTPIFIAVLVLGFVTSFYIGEVKRIDLARDAFPVNVPDEKFVRKDHLQTAEYLRKNLAGDETFMTLTSEASWYYLVDKPSPVKYPVIWFAFIPEERRELAESIQDNQDIKYIVTNNNWTTNIDTVPNEQRFPEVYEVLHAEYEPHRGFGQQTVWRRVR